jgi:hypothetical protein
MAKRSTSNWIRPAGYSSSATATSMPDFSPRENATRYRRGFGQMYDDDGTRERTRTRNDKLRPVIMKESSAPLQEAEPTIAVRKHETGRRDSTRPHVGVRAESRNGRFYGVKDEKVHRMTALPAEGRRELPPRPGFRLPHAVGAHRPKGYSSETAPDPTATAVARPVKLPPLWNLGRGVAQPRGQEQGLEQGQEHGQEQSRLQRHPASPGSEAVQRTRAILGPLVGRRYPKSESLFRRTLRRSSSKRKKSQE